MKFLHISDNFLGYNYGLEEANFVFLGVPFSSTQINSASIYSPAIIRESLKYIEWNQNFKVCDLGDIEVVPGNFKETAKIIEETIKEIKNISGAKIIFVGGEHSITLPITNALRPKTILQLDAHSDMRKEYLGERFTNATWAFHASKKCSLAQIGVRSIAEGEKNYPIGVKEIKSLEEPIYLSIDMDVFDPPYVKTGLPVSNGLSPKRVFEIIDELKNKKVLGMDIVEISDNSLPSNTGFLAAELIQKFMVTLKSR